MEKDQIVRNTGPSVFRGDPFFKVLSGAYTVLSFFFQTHIISKTDSSIIRASYSENLHIDSLSLDVLQIIDSTPVSESVFKKFFSKKIISSKKPVKGRKYERNR